MSRGGLSSPAADRAPAAGGAPAAGRARPLARARAGLMPGGRLHLAHGPIDLVIGAEGDEQARRTAFLAAGACFDGLLEALVAELPRLRVPLPKAGEGPGFSGPVARRMAAAIAPHRGFVTPMAAVAGAVADEVLAAMRAAAPLARAYVNNGGDIALYLAPGQALRSAIAAPDGAFLGQIALQPGGPAGIATSGQGGRSLSLGIADSVTVLAANAAAADAAATLVANAVDLPGHPAIARTPARDLAPDSDLGARPVVTGVGPLGAKDIATALARGARCAEAMRAAGLIHSAALFLRGKSRLVGPLPLGQYPKEAFDA